MSIPSKVVGLVQARNEWPLLALSISHALIYHVDEVYVLNHSSTDGSFEGLQLLEELWKHRIHILNFHDPHFWQEASTNALIEVSQEASPDWIYVFDADEFLLTQACKPLKEILDELDPQYLAIRYEVRNWISTENFDQTHLNDYRKLHFCSVPRLFMDMNLETLVDEIGKGNLNFFDVPFLSKVIFRNDSTAWLGAGAHALKNWTDTRTLHMNPVILTAAHFPFLCKNRVRKKARDGKVLTQDHFPITHGWQNQMIYKLSQQNKLDQFWRNHAIGSHNDSDHRALPSFIIDNDFVQAIESTIRFLNDGFDSGILQRAGELEPLSRERDDTQIPFRTLARSTQKFQEIADSIRQERDALALERDALALERDALALERDALASERDAILNSHTWRYTKFLRIIFAHFAPAHRRQNEPTSI